VLIAAAQTATEAAAETAAPNTGLLFGLMLMSAIVGAYLGQLFHLPRVIGYLAGGAALHALMQLLYTDFSLLNDIAAPLNAIKNLGLGIILFTVGSAFEIRHVKALAPRTIRIVAAESGLTVVFVLIGCLIAIFAARGAADSNVSIVLALLLALAGIATAPAATIFTLREYEAKGPVTETIMTIIGFNNVLCIILFNAAFLTLAASGLLNADLGSGAQIWLALALQTIGSIALGIVVGFGVSLVHAKLRIGEALLMLTATLILLGGGEAWLLSHTGISYNFLLTAIVTGAVFANVAIDPERLETALRTMGQPILVGFFVLAGYSLHLEDLIHLGPIGLTYVICRTIGKTVGGYLGVRWAGSPVELRNTIGAALLCQAAVVIGLADFVSQFWQHEWAARAFTTTILGSVVLFEISGPLLIKWVAVRSGEVKAATLLARGSSSGGSVFAISWNALLRMLGRQPRKAETTGVRHIMRTNVKCLHASDRLDDVLSFIESSRYNHFPVIDDDEHLVGVIHFSDIRGIIYDPTLRDLVTAVDLATTHMHPVPVSMELLDVMLVFQDGDIGSLPVVDSAETRKVVGIIEQRDVLRAIHDASRGQRRG
jgi:Kef-type K+ transport system membrane component KefB/predicted transcriptional regulator